MLLSDPQETNDDQTFAISERQMITSDRKNLFADRTNQKGDQNWGIAQQQMTNSGRLFAISGQ